MREQVGMMIHEGVGVSHLGRTKAEGAAYWVGDVRRIVKRCGPCVRYKRGTVVLRTPEYSIVSEKPWELFSIDITGMPSTKPTPEDPALCKVIAFNVNEVDAGNSSAGQYH
jgi:hypothetical protein